MMKTSLWIIAPVAILVGLVLLVRSRTAPEYRVGIHDISRVLSQLSASTSTPAFAVLMFSTPDRPGDDDVVNLQFSLEHGQPGFDWVLMSPRNIADERRFLEFSRLAGYEPNSEVMNGVHYLRIENGNLAALCSDVITKMYGLPESTSVSMIVEGFAWVP